MELPEDFPKSMPEVYRMYSDGPTILDPRVEQSWGGGMVPEQHWGRLVDGRTFYLRLRHSVATLCLGPVGSDPERDLPMTNPEYDKAAFDEAFVSGATYNVPFFQGPRPALELSDEAFGCFGSDEQRQETFTKLLDILEEELGDTELRAAVTASGDKVVKRDKDILDRLA